MSDFTIFTQRTAKRLNMNKKSKNDQNIVDNIVLTVDTSVSHLLRIMEIMK